MDARFSYYDNPAAAKFAKYLISAGKVVSDSALPAATRHLVVREGIGARDPRRHDEIGGSQ